MAAAIIPLRLSLTDYLTLPLILCRIGLFVLSRPSRRLIWMSLWSVRGKRPVA